MKMLAAVTSLVSVFALVAGADDLSGTYLVSGVEPSGVPYETTAEITTTGSTTAAITLEGAAGPYHGLCMVTELVVACHAETGGGYFSIVVYERLSEGVLSGIWTHSAYRGLGEETLTPVQ